MSTKSDPKNQVAKETESPAADEVQGSESPSIEKEQLCDEPAANEQHASGSPSNKKENSCKETLQEVMRKLFVYPTSGHWKSVEELYKSAESSSTPNHRPFVRLIASALQEIMDHGFGGGITVHIFGSYLTGLHSSGRQGDLNIYIEFGDQHNESTSGELFEKAFEVLQEAEIPFIEKVSKRADWLLPGIGFFASFPSLQIGVLCCLGPVARIIYLSSKLVLAYLYLWPYWKELALFVRKWATILKLNAPCYGGASNHMFDLMVIHFLQQTGYLPVLHQVLRNDFFDEMEGLPPRQLCSMPSRNMGEVCEKIASLHYGRRRPTRSTGSLIYGFFRFYSTEFDLGTLCQITQKEPLLKDEWRARSLIVRDPFTEKNVVKFRQETFRYYQVSLIFTARYICMPCTPKGPIYKLAYQVHFCENKADSADHQNLIMDQESPKPPTKEEIHSLLSGHEEYVHGLFFAKENFTSSAHLEPPLHCYCCNKNHLEKDCLFLSSFLPSFQALSSGFLELVSKEIERVYSAYQLSEQRKCDIFRFIKQMEDKLSLKLEKPLLSLVPFGSLINGFGQADCDLDLCLRFGDSGDCKREEQETLLSGVAEAFEEEGFIAEKVFCAKVKIVKFSGSKDTDFMGDISLSNLLALHNSEMLKLYCDFDPRVPLLGLFIKAWAKLFGINNASTGSISSYAYVILMINFLQNCEEPVLPFLQEIVEQNDVERVMVEGFDATFCHDTSTLNTLKKRFTNSQSVSMLFYGFLKYYANEVDFRFDVIQIRSRRKVTKLDKTWHDYPMCIEDPFELPHNLTGGVKARSFSHILKCFKQTIIGLRELAENAKHDKIRYFLLEQLKPYVPNKLGCQTKNRSRG